MPNTGVIEGQDMVIFIDVAGTPTPIAHSTSHTLEPTAGSRVRTTNYTGKWTSRVAGLLDWKAGCEALVCYDGYSYHELFALMINRTPVTITFAGRDAVDGNDNWTPQQVGDKYFQGSALIVGLPKTAPVNEDATFSISFEGDGELEAKTVEA